MRDAAPQRSIWAATHRRARLEGVGARPHLLPDRVKNRISVATTWLWIYLTGHRSARLITWGEAGGVTGKAKAGHA